MSEEIYNPLDCYTDKEIMYNILKNVESIAKELHFNNEFKRWWDMYPNWIRVQRIINRNTSRAGSKSSTLQCLYIGINPESKSLDKV